MMKRNLKALGLALFAALALSAVAASGAGAAEGVQQDHFISEVEKTVITGEDTAADPIVFGFKNSAIEFECEEATYAGTIDKKVVTEIGITPTYEGCTSGILGEINFTNEETCEVLLTGETTTSEITGGGTQTDARVDLFCTESIVLDTICPITFEKEQKELHGVTYNNVEDEYEEGKFIDAIEIAVTIDKIKYTTPGGFLCLLSGLPAEGADGTLTGTILATGFKDEEAEPPATTHDHVFKHSVTPVDIEVTTTE